MIRALRQGGYAYLNQIKPVSDIDTMELLLNLLQATTDEDTAQKTCVRDWLSRLVQRFEVTKRLYTRYPSGLKKGAEKYDQIILYALLAFLLGHYFGKNGNLNYLNTLLKLNDLICSVLESVTQDQLTCTTAYFSLAFEHIYVKELMVHKGLNQCISLT